MTTIGLLHPGEMGSMVGAAVRSGGSRVLWAGDVIEDVDETGQRIEGETLLILLNAHHEPIPFQIPAHDHGARWELVLDTATDSAETRSFAADEKYDLRERSLVVLRLGRPEQADQKASARSP